MKTTLIRAVVFMWSFGTVQAQQNSALINYVGLEESINPAHFSSAQVKIDLIKQESMFSEITTPSTL